jgi:hypothetical protein
MMRDRVLRFHVIYRVTCDAMMRDRIVMCSKWQFNFCFLFIWLSNITPRLPRQPGVTGTHVTYEIFGQLHVEIFQGALPGI